MLNRRNSTTIEFGTKAETLERLQGVLSSAIILPQARFTVSDWQSDRNGCLKRISAAMPSECDKVIVRSSAINEDSAAASQAGRYQSFPAVVLADPRALVKAIEATIASYGPDPRPEHQVFIQPFLKDFLLSGVAFTRDLDTGGPYFCINYDDATQSSQSVTAGKSGHLKTYVQFKDYPSPDSRFSDLIKVLRDIEACLQCDSLDVEFALGRNGEVFIWQVRPLAMKERWGESKEVPLYLQKIHKKILKLSDRHPYLFGNRTILGVMPDWNPAEMIGVKPRPLALSLYKQLITDRTWAYQRDNYGYKNLRSYPLMVSLVGHPYIDVRVSVNSFVPKGVPDALTERLVNYYLTQLEENPASHDKIEFDIIFSCYFFGIDAKLEKLLDFGFQKAEIQLLKNELRNLTNSVIKPEGGVFSADLARIENLRERQGKVLGSDLPLLDKIYWLCEDCCRYGTLPFAGLARAGFIAVQILRSLVDVGFLTRNEYAAFMSSLNTVAKQMSRDHATLSKHDFLKIYGHLRPGTYDILSLRYDTGYDLYFSHGSLPFKKETPFDLSGSRLKELGRLLHKEGWTVGPEDLIGFLRAAIEGREFSKFIFTKSVSEVIELIAGLCERYGISRQEASYLDIRTLLGLYATVDHRDLESILREEISRNRIFYEATKLIKMPPLVLQADDIYQFELMDDAPNYITLDRCRAETVKEEDLLSVPLKGKIICLRCADPGYDWIFSKEIAGLITQYGGANSHMAIRSAELKIPAVIGAGEKKYLQWAQAEALEIDCANKIVRRIR